MAKQASSATAPVAAQYQLSSELRVKTGIDTVQRNMAHPKVVWRSESGGAVKRGTNRGRVLEALQGLGPTFSLAQAIEALAALQAGNSDALGAGGKPSGWVSSWVRKGYIVAA